MGTEPGGAGAPGGAIIGRAPGGMGPPGCCGGAIGRAAGGMGPPGCCGGAIMPGAGGRMPGGAMPPGGPIGRMPGGACCIGGPPGMGWPGGMPGRCPGGMPIGMGRTPLGGPGRCIRGRTKPDLSHTPLTARRVWRTWSSSPINNSASYSRGGVVVGVSWGRTRTLEVWRLPATNNKKGSTHTPPTSLFYTNAGPHHSSRTV